MPANRLALAFDKSDMFGADKPAGVPCPNLDPGHQCTIHTHLIQKGFTGCVRYNCFGAGQRVTEELYDGRSWRDYPAEAQEMFVAYQMMYKVHEHLAMLEAAQKLDLDIGQHQQCTAFKNSLMPETGWTVATLKQLMQTALFDEITAFFRGLHDRV